MITDANHLPLQVVQQRTMQEMTSYRRFAERGTKLDLRELINSKLPQPFKTFDERSIEAWHEVSEGCRQRGGGTAANGTYLPLQYLIPGVSQRDLLTSSASAGGNAVTAIIAREGSASLRPANGVFGAGATVLSGLSGSSFFLPTIDSTFDASTAWIAENSNAPQLEPSFKGTTLTPYTLSVQQIVTHKLLQNSSIDLDALLRQELANRISLAVDLAGINGSGVSNQPAGILSNADLEVISAGTDGLAPALSHLVELEFRVMNRIGGQQQRPAFLTSPALAKKMRTTPKAGGDRFLYEGADLLGYPVNLSPNVPDNLTKGTTTTCTPLLFGDWSEVFVGFWGPLAVDILVDPYKYAKQHAVLIVARCEVGVGVRRIRAFAGYKDMIAA